MNKRPERPLDEHRLEPRPPPPVAAPVDWCALYEALGERVFRMLHRMTGDAEAAADLTHDCFVRVHHARAQFDGSGSVEAWVFRIAGNLARDALRRRRLEAVPVEAPQELAGPARGPRIDHELRLSLERAIAGLEDGQRTVLLLHDVDGYAHREIAEMLDVAVGTSKARLSRAREALRDVFET